MFHIYITIFKVSYTMAYKVTVLGVLLFICLIDSLHSASYERVKRDAEEAPTKAEPNEKETPDKGSTDTSSNKGGESGNPMDVSKIVDNIGQMFSVSGSPEWMKNANSWFTNMPSIPNWFGGGGSGGGKE